MLARFFKFEAVINHHEDINSLWLCPYPLNPRRNFWVLVFSFRECCKCPMAGPAHEYKYPMVGLLKEFK